MKPRKFRITKLLVNRNKTYCIFEATPECMAKCKGKNEDGVCILKFSKPKVEEIK